MDSIRLHSWIDDPVGRNAKVPAVIEYRYCPTDNAHWLVSGDNCPVCRCRILVLHYTIPPSDSSTYIEQIAPPTGFQPGPELFSQNGYNRKKDAALRGLRSVIEQVEKDQYFNAFQRMSGVMANMASALQSILNRGSWRS